MNVYVCVKHVPDTAVNITVIDRTGFEESMKFIVNPYDEHAIEEAYQIAEKEGGEVIIVCVGKKTAETTIRSALATGGDRGILIKTDKQFLDSALTAEALKKAIVNDGEPGMIFMGKQSIDSEGMQTCHRLGSKLDMPVATEVVKLSLEGGKAVATREIGGGEQEVIQMTTPCIIGATKGLNEPQYPKLRSIMQAKKKEIKQIDMQDLGIESEENHFEIVSLEPVPERSGAKMLNGNLTEAVQELVTLLKEEAKVL